MGPGRDARGMHTVLRRSVLTVLACTGLLVTTVATTAPAAAAQGHQRRRTTAAWGVSVPGAPVCNPLGASPCMAPFPSDYYTVPDRAMPSGRRIDFPKAAMPANNHGAHINPVAWERNDGFSPGSPILATVPGLDAATTGLPPSGNIDACLRPRSPVVLWDLTTHTRLACWAEMDVRNPSNPKPMLLVHPAANLPEGTRVAVALRNMKTSSGGLIAPHGDFAAIVAGHRLPGAAGAAVEHHSDHLLAQLRAAGVRRHGLFLAWDFTVASSKNLTSWAIAMRDQAFHQLGSGAPAFEVTQVHNFTAAQNPQIARQVVGTFNVPSFLNKPGGPQGSFLHFGRSKVPRQIPGNVQKALFACLIPRASGLGATKATTARPGRPVLYGKGLFSVATEMDASGVIATAQRYDLVLCSTNWMGLDGNDEVLDAHVLANLSAFPTIPDRLQQSMIDALFLGRLMNRTQGFDANPAFRLGSTPLIDTKKELTYYGNSEGSLMGGAVTAISNEWRRAVLGVPSMDYAILLSRSVDFSALQTLLNVSYPNPNQQLVIFDLLQMLWDRGETDGYVENLVHHQLPGTPTHHVLLQMAYGDHQVANVSTEIEARTLHAGVHRPAFRRGRAQGAPFQGLASLSNSQPAHTPAALYMWDDVNVAPPPAGNVPPSVGPDPHDSVPRAVPTAQRQLATFLETGKVPNVCGNSPCVTNLALSG